MINTRIRRMLRELQCEPVTQWLCELLSVLEPRQMDKGGDIRGVPTR